MDNINYWKDEDERKQYINDYPFDKKIYKEFFVSASNKGILEKGIAYPKGKAPSYPDHTTITIKTEGFSQDEINDAIKCLSVKLYDAYIIGEGRRASIISAERINVK